MIDTKWVTECTSAIRMAVHCKKITKEQAHQAVDDIFSLQVDLIPASAILCKSAPNWAASLNQARAYDATYLAMAQSLNIEFWTADKRLANAGKQLKLDWIHWVGEE